MSLTKKSWKKYLKDKYRALFQCITCRKLKKKKPILDLDNPLIQNDILVEI